MSLSFNPNTPGASDIVAVTQPLIQTNFQSLNTAFNSTNTGGNFTQYAMQNVHAVLSGGTLPANPIGIFHMVNGANFFTGSPIPYFANSQGDFPLLPDLKTVVVGGATDNGFKLGNIVVCYGFGSVTGSPSTYTITFAVPFTNSTSYAITVAPKTAVSLSDGMWSVNPSSGTQCVVTRGSVSGNLGFLYIAIGT